MLILLGWGAPVNNPPPVPRKTLDAPSQNVTISQPSTSSFVCSQTAVNSSQNILANEFGNTNINNSSFNDISNKENSLNASQINEAGPSVKKRNIDELFGDIDDLLSEDITGPQLKKYKTREDSDKALIEHIVGMYITPVNTIQIY